MNADFDYLPTVSASLRYWRGATTRADEPALAMLERERHNLYRALQFGLSRPETWSDAAEVALQAFPFVERRGYWHDWITIIELLLSHCPGSDLPRKRRLLHCLGLLYRLSFQLPQAVQTHRREEALARQLIDPLALAQAFYNLSETYLHLREYEQGEQAGLEALARFEPLLPENKSWVAATYDALGQIAQRRGKLSLAAERLQRTVALRRELGEPAKLGRALNALGMVFELQQNFEQALRTYDEAMALLETTGSEFDRMLVLINVGTLYFRQQQWAQAAETFRQINQAYLRRAGHTYYEALVANNRGNALLELGRCEEAEAQLRHAIPLWRQAGDEVQLGNTTGTLGALMIRCGRPAVARPLLEEAITLLEKHEDDAWARKLLADFKALLAKIKDG